MVRPVMNTKHSLFALSFVTLLGASASACDSEAPAKAEAGDKADDKAEAGAETAERAPADKALPAATGAAPALPKPCDLIDAELVRKAAELPTEAPIIVGDMLGADEVTKDAVSCSWKFGDKTIALQVTREPAGNKFDTWASRMVTARADQGFSAVEGLADGAMFKADDSHLVFRHGEAWLYSLSYAGDRPGDTMSLEKLQPLAAAVPKP